MKNEVKKYLAKIGRRGGSNGKGASKARSSILARRAANTRWKGKMLHRDMSATNALPGALQIPPPPEGSVQKSKTRR